MMNCAVWIVQQPDHNKKENQEYMNKIYAHFAAVQSIYSETKKEIEKNQLVNWRKNGEIERDRDEE